MIFRSRYTVNPDGRDGRTEAAIGSATLSGLDATRAKTTLAPPNIQDDGQQQALLDDGPVAREYCSSSWLSLSM